MNRVGMGIHLGIWLGLVNAVNAEAPTAEIALELAKDTILCGENVVCTVRIRNTSGRELVLDGFTVGHDIPRVQMREGAGPWRKLCRGNASDSDRTRGVVIFEKDQERTYQILLLSSPMFVPTGFHEPGIYELRPTMPIAAVIDPDSVEREAVSWRSPSVTLTVVEPQGRNLQAYQALRRREAEIDAGIKDGTISPTSLDYVHLQFRRDFLAEFGETPYATDIRLRLAKTLVHRVKGQEGRKLSTEKRSALAHEVIRLLTTLADQGEFYARRVLGTLAEMHVVIPEVRDLEAAEQTVDRWIQVAPDNAEAKKAKKQVQRLRSQER